MSIDQIDDKRRALEEIFFAKQNRELIEKMKAQATQVEICSELAKVSGLSHALGADSFHQLHVDIMNRTSKVCRKRL